MKKILIANRGEIVLRVARTCKRLGLQSVAVYSDLDAGLPHVSACNDAFSLGGGVAQDTYLNGAKIIEIAKSAGCDAIHPGYGFLSENPEFCEQVTTAGLVFIGPSPKTMRLLGGKHSARVAAAGAQVPVIPGYDGDDQTLSRLTHEAERIEVPLMIKASAGGGGKGMRRIETLSEFSEAVSSAKREAQAAFSNDRLILEKLVFPVRHIEVQLIGDTHRNVLHFFERDCSLQRRQQKIIEETPASNLSPALRQKICDAAVTIGKRAELSNATTVEFLVPSNDSFYFLEANCRLQVEHPVTEMVTGLDLVELQLLAASGKPLPLKQENIQQNGHAVQARIYAELPGKHFAPSSGTVRKLVLPGESKQVRLDHALQQGMIVGTAYDPMLAKVICHGKTRKEAFSTLQSALENVLLLGLETNIPFLLSLLSQSTVQRGGVSTRFVTDHLEDLLWSKQFSALLPIASICYFVSRASSQCNSDQNDPFHSLPFFRPRNIETSSGAQLGGGARVLQVSSAAMGAQVRVTVELLQIEHAKQAGLLPLLHLEVDGRNFEVEKKENKCVVDGVSHITHIEILDPISQKMFIGISGYIFIIEEILFEKGLESGTKEAASNQIVSPLPGKVISVRAKAGDQTSAGDILAIVESMKMEHSITAPRSATVSEVRVAEGMTVREGELLFSLI